MTGKKVFIALAVITALSILSASSAAAGHNRWPRGGYVVPCSLDGVNPVYHPGIFGNPAFAKGGTMSGACKTTVASIDIELVRRPKRLAATSTNSGAADGVDPALER